MLHRFFFHELVQSVKLRKVSCMHATFWQALPYVLLCMERRTTSLCFTWLHHQLCLKAHSSQTGKDSLYHPLLPVLILQSSYILLQLFLQHTEDYQPSQLFLIWRSFHMDQSYVKFFSEPFQFQFKIRTKLDTVIKVWSKTAFIQQRRFFWFAPYSFSSNS